MFSTFIIPVKCQLVCHLYPCIWTHLLLFDKIFTVPSINKTLQVNVTNHAKKRNINLKKRLVYRHNSGTKFSWSFSIVLTLRKLKWTTLQSCIGDTIKWKKCKWIGLTLLKPRKMNYRVPGRRVSPVYRSWRHNTLEKLETCLDLKDQEHVPNGVQWRARINDLIILFSYEVKIAKRAIHVWQLTCPGQQLTAGWLPLLYWSSSMSTWMEFLNGFLLMVLFRSDHP